MAKGFKHGGSGGGGELNFRFVTGLTQPETGTRNDIWVQTEEAVTDWCFSATQPETAREGAVWVVTAESSAAAFNASRKQTLTVYPARVLQYSQGSWVDRAARVYTGDGWMEVASQVMIIENGTVDLTAYPYSYESVGYPANTSGGAGDSVIRQAQEYNGKSALWLKGLNGTWYHHRFAGIPVPGFATKFVVEYYRICCYNNDPYFMLGQTKVTLNRAGANYLENGTAVIDVTALRGQTVTFEFANYGQAYNQDNYLGNAWFE